MADARYDAETSDVAIQAVYDYKVALDNEDKFPLGHHFETILFERAMAHIDAHSAKDIQNATGPCVDQEGRLRRASFGSGSEDLWYLNIDGDAAFQMILDKTARTLQKVVAEELASQIKSTEEAPRNFKLTSTHAFKHNANPY